MFAQRGLGNDEQINLNRRNGETWKSKARHTEI